MEKKGLTFTAVFLAQSANYGEVIGNVAALKKISRNNRCCSSLTLYKHKT